MGGDETEAKAGVPGHLGRSVRPAPSDAANGWTPGYAAVSPFNAGSAGGGLSCRGVPPRGPARPPGPRPRAAGLSTGQDSSLRGRPLPDALCPLLRPSRLPRASKPRASRESSLRTDRRAQRSL